MKVNIHCLNGNDLEIQNHYHQKEYRNDIVVEIDGTYYEVYFFLPKALDYEMTTDGYFSLPGIIVLDDMTFEKICIAINSLIDLNFFSTLKGSNDGPLFERFIRKWFAETSPIPGEDRSTVYMLRE